WLLSWDYNTYTQKRHLEAFAIQLPRAAEQKLFCITGNSSEFPVI
ncbi:MAG: hypothetical protein K0R00_4394, partial [Herbinix sp.]|nr:hypothetical protein [Herbinix sp.]